MNGYSEQTRQRKLMERLASRDNSYVPFNLAGDETIPRLFRAQVLQHGDKPAIVSSGGSVTYRQLYQMSSDIGHALRRAPGRKDSAVVLLLSQHSSFAASMLATFSTDRFYVPLDPSFPEHRNALILQEFESPIILTDRSHGDLITQMGLPDGMVLYLEDFLGEQQPLEDISHPDSLASVVFTSGTTGRPKGVMQTQRNLLHVVKRYSDSLCVGAGDRMSLLSSCSVAATQAPLLSSLLNGATLCALSVLDGTLNTLADWLDAEQITIYHSVPSLFRQLLGSLATDRVLSTLQVVRLGGDAAYRKDWELFSQHCRADAVLVNSYGCSEMSSVARFYMDAESQISCRNLPIGYPSPDLEIFLLNTDDLRIELQQGGDESAGLEGQIVLRSRYLSPGYWSTYPGGGLASTVQLDTVRTYRTGDLATLRPGQGIVHMGRGDFQVKITGFRVEIAEIEDCLQECPGLRAAAVLPYTAAHGEQRLFGIVEMDSGELYSGPLVRAFVAARLPSHMVPAEIVAVSKLPTTPNGKVDRGALPNLRDQLQSIKNRSTPETVTECTLHKIWTEALNEEEIGVNDDFFALGGDSLLMMRVDEEVARHFLVEVPPIALFDRPTIREVAHVIDGLRGSNSASESNGGSLPMAQE